MKKKRKSNLKLILILLVFGLTIGFALLTATLNINGIGRLNKATWNIHWENVEVKEGSVTATTPAYIVDEKRTIVEYSIVLTKPGDFYEFTVDAKNDGTIDGMIAAIDNKLYDENDDVIDPIPSYLTYTVTYSDGKEIENDHLLKVGRSEKYKVKVKFKETITEEELPEEDVSLSFKFSVTYNQSNTNATIRDAICDASIYDEGELTESRYLDKCEDYIDDSIYTYETNDSDPSTITITGFKDGYTVQQVKSAVRDLKASRLNNTEDIKIRKVDNHVISFKDGVWAIPISIDGKKVTNISGDAFYNKNITAQLVLPPTLVSLDDGELAYDDEEEYIYYGAFSSNNLTGVALPTGLKVFGDHVFFNNNFSSVKIPDGVTYIGSAAFNKHTNLSNVKLGKGLEVIKSGAFSGCSSLTDVDFPYGLTTVEGGAFSGTSLKKVILPDTVTTLNGGSFYTNTVEEINTGNGLTQIAGGYFNLDNVKKMVVGDSVTLITSAGYAPNLTSLHLGNSVETIGESSFGNCKIKELKLPNSVREVRNGAFSGCRDIEDFDTGDGLTKMNSGTFTLPNAKRIRVGNNVTEINALGTTSALEDLYLGTSLRTITNGSFYSCKLKKIEIPDTLTTVNNGSFSGCNLVEEIYTGGATRIGTGVFGTSGEYIDDVYVSYSTMENLKKLVIGPGTVEIADSAFSGATKLEEIVWGDNLTTITGGAMSGLNLPRLELPDTLRTVTNGAFSSCNIKYLDTGDGITDMHYSFSGNPFETVIFGDGFETIPSGAFNYKSTLTSVTFGKNVTTIENSAFYNSNLSTVDLSGTKVVTIGDSAFENNNISTLDLGNYVETIGERAFASNNLSGTLSTPSSLKYLKDLSFYNNSIQYLYLNTGLIYLSGFGSNSITSLSIPNTVTTIGQEAFNRMSISTVRIPSNVQEVKREAFYSSGVKYLYLYNGLTTIGNLAFANNQISSLSIPSTVQNIEHGAFASNRVSGDDAFIYQRTDGVVDNTTLNSYAGYGGTPTLPSTVTNVAANAFWCTWITGLDNYSQVTYFGDYAFGNTSVTSFTAPSGLTVIPTGLFFASKVETLDLGNVTSIGGAAFQYCRLTTVTIPSTVETMYGNAFAKASNSNPNLTTIVNTTGRSFNWGNIINYSSGYEFETGTVENSAGNVTITN